MFWKYVLSVHKGMIMRPSVVKMTTAFIICFLTSSVLCHAQKNGDETPPQPERVVKKTNDNVNLVFTYYGGTKGKESVPVILLHDLDGNRKDYTAFAAYLQKSYGCAVIVPDLRGHGESTQTVTNVTIDRSKFRKQDYLTFNEDISTCFRYLRDEVNNKGNANIDQLCLIATGYLGINATAWTLEDYSYQPVGGKKQGQFVKGLVLISPRKSIKGFGITTLIKLPLFTGKGAKPLPMMLAIGEGNDRSYRDGLAIYKSLERTRPKVADIPDVAEYFKKQSIFLRDYPESAGAGLLSPNSGNNLGVEIAKFIRYKIVAKSDQMPWVNYQKSE